MRMKLDEFPVFRDYLLLRKLYVFSLTSYERVLLLDLDGVVTGSLRFLFEASMVCGEEIAPPDRNTGEHCVAIDPEVCEHGETAEILAQQTSGTPVLTAYMMVRPDDEVWRDVANELTANCGGGFVCDRKRVNSFGWGSATGTAIDAPHDWATRAKPKRFVKKDAADLSWSRMGAGFSDQGFVEYLFALKRRRAKLVSKWSCAKRLHYLHFNVPPKPWNCPENEACRRDVDTRTTNVEYSMDASALRHDRGGDFERRPRSQRLQEQQKRKEWWDSPSETLAFGGHHCAQDWWWQYDLARASLRKSPGSCVATCAADLDLAMERRRDPSYENYTPGPRCAHLWEKKNSHSSSSSSSK